MMHTSRQLNPTTDQGWTVTDILSCICLQLVVAVKQWQLISSIVMTGQIRCLLLASLLAHRWRLSGTALLYHTVYSHLLSLSWLTCYYKRRTTYEHPMVAVQNNNCGIKEVMAIHNSDVMLKIRIVWLSTRFLNSPLQDRSWAVNFSSLSCGSPYR